MRRRVSVACGLVLCALTAEACGAPTPGGSAEPSRGCRAGTLPAADGVRGEVAGRSYLLDAPSGPADRPAPLVLAFHGFRSDPDDLRAGTGLTELARTAGFVVAYPSGREGVRLLGSTGRGWDMRPEDTVDRDFVSALLDRLETQRCIDRRRLYATGFSNGGLVASLLGCRLADRLAAVAPVAGAVDLGDCAPARPVPILLLYGGADRVVPPDVVRRGIDWWVQRNACGAASSAGGCSRWAGCAADVVACEGAQGHRWPPGASEKIGRFFAAHPRP